MLSDQDFMRIVDHIKNNYGIELIHKRLLIEGRLSFIVSKNNFSGFGEYIDYVLSHTDSALYQQFIDRLTTNHTYFMREQGHFDIIRNEILPYIEKTVISKDVRIWSAGCSFGHEPYNLAMVIDDYFGERKKGWDLKILATDISTTALIKAKTAIYSGEDIKELPEMWRKKYFNKLPDNRYQIKEFLRSQVVFKYQNLMEDFNNKKPFDLILCRNVMIYYDSETRDELVNKFYNDTKIGGYLLIGHAENVSVKSRYTMVKPSVLRRTE